MITFILSMCGKPANGCTRLMGKLIYLMGPSGSGKDSILSRLRQQLHPQSRLIIAHRYITRHWQSGGENHVELSDTEFELRKSLNLFSMHWEANQNKYAIGCEVDAWIQAKNLVLVNGSRSYLDNAKSRYKDKLIPVMVMTNESTLRSRLLARGREDEATIALRIQRANDYPAQISEPLHILDNNGTLDRAVLQFELLIEQLAKEATNA